MLLVSLDFPRHITIAVTVSYLRIHVSQCHVLGHVQYCRFSTTVVDNN